MARSIVWIRALHRDPQTLKTNRDLGTVRANNPSPQLGGEKTKPFLQFFSMSSQYICMLKGQTKQKILLEQKCPPLPQPSLPISSLTVRRLLFCRVQPMTVSCSSFVQALCKYIHIFMRRQREIHITFDFVDFFFFCTTIQIGDDV